MPVRECAGSMIAEIIPEAYDAIGKQVSQPFHHRRGLHSTFPMGRYFSRPLTVRCKSLEEMRTFLCGCRGVSDEKLLVRVTIGNHQMSLRSGRPVIAKIFLLGRGDSCWTWDTTPALYSEEVEDMGLATLGVSLFQNDRWFLLEPQAAPLGVKLPQLSTLRFQPRYAVSSNSGELKYYAHKGPAESHVPLVVAIRLLPEWCRIWGWFWLKVAVRLLYWTARRILRSASAKNPHPTGSL